MLKIQNVWFSFVMVFSVKTTQMCHLITDMKYFWDYLKIFGAVALSL